MSHITRKSVKEMIIPDGTLKTVAFLCYRDKSKDIRFAGTCFFVKDRDSETGLSFPYTVTALHVINGIREKSSDGIVLLRFNRKDGGTEYIEKHVSQWVAAPQDEEVIDVAVIEYAPDATIYDILYIETGIIVSQELITDNSVELGNEIVIAGLFVNHDGGKRNAPIIRYGNIAMIPENKINTKFGLMTGYLIESRSIGGLSGSPVFVWTDRPITRKTETGSISSQMILLLGLVHGHYEAIVPHIDEAVEDSIKDESVNMGIAIVIPATKILQTIYENDELKHSRKIRIEKEKG